MCGGNEYEITQAMGRAGASAVRQAMAEPREYGSGYTGNDRRNLRVRVVNDKRKRRYQYMNEREHAAKDEERQAAIGRLRNEALAKRQEQERRDDDSGDMMLKTVIALGVAEAMSSGDSAASSCDTTSDFSGGGGDFGGGGASGEY